MRSGLWVALDIIGLCLATVWAERGAGQVIVHDMDIGRTVRIAVGGSLIVRLASNPSTGYQWRDSGGRCLQPVGRPQYEEPATASLGASGIQVFRYKAIHAGTVQLRFRYVRPWEQRPVRSFAVTVHIVEPEGHR